MMAPMPATKERTPRIRSLDMTCNSTLNTTDQLITRALHGLDSEAPLQQVTTSIESIASTIKRRFTNITVLATMTCFTFCKKQEYWFLVKF